MLKIYEWIHEELKNKESSFGVLDYYPNFLDFPSVKPYPDRISVYESREHDIEIYYLSGKPAPCPTSSLTKVTDRIDDYQRVVTFESVHRNVLVIFARYNNNDTLKKTVHDCIIYTGDQWHCEHNVKDVRYIKELLIGDCFECIHIPKKEV